MNFAFFVYNLCMEKIFEVIVVEGQNDINKVKSCLDCDCLKTNGTHLSKTFLDSLKELNQTRGIIVLTDDDYPGRWIRTQIQETLGTVKHAYIDKKVSSTPKKVGVEHAHCQEIIKAINQVRTMKSFQQSMTYSEYLELDLVLNSQKRNELIKKMGLPRMNGRRFFNVLNMMGISAKELDV